MPFVTRTAVLTILRLKPCQTPRASEHRFGYGHSTFVSRATIVKCQRPPSLALSDPFSATASTVTSWPQSSNSHAPGHRKFPTKEASNSTIRLNVAAVTMRTDRACPVTFAPVLNHLCPQRCIAWFPSRAPIPLLDTKMLPGAIQPLDGCTGCPKACIYLSKEAQNRGESQVQ